MPIESGNISLAQLKVCKLHLEREDERRVSSFPFGSPRSIRVCIYKVVSSEGEQTVETILVKQDALYVARVDSEDSAHFLRNFLFHVGRICDSFVYVDVEVFAWIPLQSEIEATGVRWFDSHRGHRPYVLLLSYLCTYVVVHNAF